MASSSSLDVNQIAVALHLFFGNAVRWADRVVSGVDAEHRHFDSSGVLVAGKKVIKVFDVVESQIGLPKFVIHFLVVLKAQKQLYF